MTAADVVVEGDRIAEIQIVGHPLTQIDPEGRPEPGDHEIDAHGMYLLPGLIDSHVHMLGPSSTKTGLGPEYYYYLNLAHGSRGITGTPLCADLLADLITGQALPVDSQLVDALDPSRFIVRKRKKQPEWKPCN